jgi:hypothetical protein
MEDPSGPRCTELHKLRSGIRVVAQLETTPRMLKTPPSKPLQRQNAFHDRVSCSDPERVIEVELVPTRQLRYLRVIFLQQGPRILQDL